MFICAGVIAVMALRCGSKQPFGRGGLGTVPDELQSDSFMVWT